MHDLAWQPIQTINNLFHYLNPELGQGSVAELHHCASEIIILIYIHNYPGGATVKKNMGKTSGVVAEVVYQWYFVC